MKTEKATKRRKSRKLLTFTAETKVKEEEEEEVIERLTGTVLGKYFNCHCSHTAIFCGDKIVVVIVAHHTCCFIPPSLPPVLLLLFRRVPRRPSCLTERHNAVTNISSELNYVYVPLQR